LAPPADLATYPTRRHPTFEAVALANLRQALASPGREVCADLDHVAPGAKRGDFRTRHEQVQAASTVGVLAKARVVAEIEVVSPQELLGLSTCNGYADGELVVIEFVAGPARFPLGHVTPVPSPHPNAGCTSLATFSTVSILKEKRITT
jgi:hypothetical protein